MAADQSFDVVSKVEIQEVKNAIDQATKEVNARFDLKNSKSTIALKKHENIKPPSRADRPQKNQVKEGLPSEAAKKIQAFIKDSKVKANSSIQGEVVRVSSKD